MELYGQTWWRFSRYAVADGYLVPASPGLRIEPYWPWNAPPEDRSPPYLELAEVPDKERDNIYLPPSPGEEARMITWSNRWGPTGWLLTSLVEVALPDGNLIERTGTGWSVHPANRIFGKGRHEEYLLLANLEPLRWPPTTPSVEREPLTKTWWRFFPDLWRDRHTYNPYLFGDQDPLPRDIDGIEWPHPGTDRFRQEYRESVPDFMEAALYLRSAIQEAEQGLNADDDELRWNSVVLINHLQRRAARAVYPAERRGVVLRVVAPSLLEELAVMFADDLAGGRDFRNCARVTCRRLFRVSDPRNRFCSMRCNDAERARRYRRAQKGAAKGRADEPQR